MQNEQLFVPPCKHLFARDITWSLAVFYELTDHFLLCHLLNRLLTVTYFGKGFVEKL